MTQQTVDQLRKNLEEITKQYEEAVLKILPDWVYDREPTREDCVDEGEEAEEAKKAEKAEKALQAKSESQLYVIAANPTSGQSTNEYFREFVSIETYKNLVASGMVVPWMSTEDAKKYTKAKVSLPCAFKGYIKHLDGVAEDVAPEAQVEV